jgi:ubiquinone/menaquinone biosynthesis C-methylase UbiE
VKTEWDYTDLAEAYLKRPDYADTAIDAMLLISGVKDNEKVCDIGAGVAHLTLMLARRGIDVVAIEPNDAMRANGIKRTQGMPNVRWQEGTAEKTGQPSQSCGMVTFGSSFNVCNRQIALAETARILKPEGWFACLWNHRKLDDPIQEGIEEIIKNKVPDYGYGTRREDQTEIIESSGLFNTVLHLNSCITHVQTVKECVEAWRSHATLQRQAEVIFDAIIDAIEQFLISKRGAYGTIKIPYTTNVWMARRKDTN